MTHQEIIYGQEISANLQVEAMRKGSLLYAMMGQGIFTSQVISRERLILIPVQAQLIWFLPDQMTSSLQNMIHPVITYGLKEQAVLEMIMPGVLKLT